MFFFISCTKTKNTVTLIPEGYTGIIKIRFNQKNGIKEKYEGEKRVYEIPENGILKTRFEPQFGYHFRDYYFVSKNGKRFEIKPILDLNKKTLDTIDKNKIYAYKFMMMGERFKIDSLENEIKIETEIIFNVGNPLKGN
jgi:hypothetical protein